MDPATITAIASILAAAVPEIIGGVTTEVLSGATKALVQKFRQRQSQI